MTYVGKKPADIIATAVDTTTGTFSGDLTVDTSTLYVDSANNRVGVGTVSPSQSLHVKGNIDVEGDTSGVSKIRFKAEETHGEVEGINIGTNFGGLAFKTNSNGTVAERMRIDSSGNVGIGKTPTTTLDIKAGSPIIQLEDNDASGAYSQINATGTEGSILITADANNAASGTHIDFRVDGTERMRIDSSGNLLVGKTSSSGSNVGAELRSNGRVFGTSDGIEPLFLNRLTSDGTIATFRKDGNEVGTIGTSNGDLYIGTGDTGLRFHDGDNSIYSVNATTGAKINGAVDLGESAGRFKDLYLSGGVYLGGTGSANKLDDYEEGTWTPAFRNDGSTTYSIQYGRYVKIGSLVMAAVHLDVSSNNIGTNAIQIETLPFTSTNDNANAYGSSSSLHCNNWNSGVKPDHFIISPNSTFATGYGSVGQAGLIYPNGNDLGTGNLIVTLIYRTDS
jgi:uncharacterized protein YqkB